MTRTLKVSFVAILLACVSFEAEAIRISFLNESQALDSTVKFLKDSGCRGDAAAAFRRAVERYNSVPLELDLRKFPSASNGFYSFQSSTQILAALPHNLRETPHAWELNCYDAVIIVAAGQLRSRLGPDDIFGLSLSPQVGTNGEWMIQPTATARDAFTWSVPLWYAAASADFFPRSEQDARVNLVAALYGWYWLPSATDDGNLGEKVMETLRAAWKRQAIEFPSNCEVVLCHEVHVKQRTFGTVHAGLLFATNGGYTYLEKDSGCGPFVRLDFEARAELLLWLAGKPDKPHGKEPARFFATFNDTKLEELVVRK
jgi:hypothetical protein